MIGKAKTDEEIMSSGETHNSEDDEAWLSFSTPMPFHEIPPFEVEVWDLFDNAAAILISKHRDYGPKNISQSPGGPLNGLRVRIWDKIARINNLIDAGAEPEHESLRDSFLDLANYSLIACMVLDGTWPNE
jgi:hypothetical protein